MGENKMKRIKKVKNLLIFSIVFFLITMIMPLTATSVIEQAKYSEGKIGINVDKIWFNWGSQSKAITLEDCETNESLVTPEFDTSAERNNPAAYVKGEYVTIKVKFRSQDVSSVLIKATGTFEGVTEKQVVFENDMSDWVNFTTINPIPTRIEIHNISWEWSYYNPSTTEWDLINTTSHTIYALNKEPITKKIWKKLAGWTTKWCEGLSDDDKQLADAILNGFVNDEVIQYGGPGWDTSELLRTGDGMCGGMSEVFHDACAAQGVKTIVFGFVLLDTFGLQRLWNGFVCKDPGLGRTEPGLMSYEMTWRLIDDTYPYPSYFGPGNESDDVNEQYMRAYHFWDHAVSLLEYENEIYLYDLSFGKGPYIHPFNPIPKPGLYRSEQLHDFRQNFFDQTIDYVHGNIYYLNELGETVMDNTNFSVKPSIIPDKIGRENQMLYLFIFRHRSLSDNCQIQSDFYTKYLKNIIETSDWPIITIEEKNLIENWFENPSVEINWMELHDAILKLGKSRKFLDVKYAKDTLNHILDIDTEINVPPKCSLSGWMPPLQMIKTAATAALESLNPSNIDRNISYHQFTNPLFIRFLEQFPLLEQMFSTASFTKLLTL
jgi:hypothetical protein